MSYLYWNVKAASYTNEQVGKKTGESYSLIIGGCFAERWLLIPNSWIEKCSRKK